MSGVRLYIGGLGESVDESVLKRHLATYGTVAQADIKEKKDAEGIVMTRFAYVNVEASNIHIQQCINSLNGSVWKGSRLKVERARESFMERLQRERASNNQQQQQQQQKGQQQAKISRHGPVKDTQINQTQKPLQNIQKQQVNKRPLVIADQKKIDGTVNKKKKVESSSSESSETDSSDDSDEVNNGIPMFRGTASFIDNEIENNIKTVNISNPKNKHIEKEDTSKLKNTMKVKQYGDSGLFNDSMVRSKDKVEEALLSNFKNFSSVWGDSDDEDEADNDEEESDNDMSSESGNEEKEKKADTKDSSSKSEEPGFFIDLQPAKASSMQSGVAHNKSRSAAANDDNEEDGIGDVVSERQSQLDILSNILGKPIEVTEHKTDEKKGRQQMKRYDPTLPEHKQYEISREKQQQQSASQELDKTEIAKQEVHTDSIEQQTLNKDKYIKVSQNLNFKEKSEGFSLLSMFSQKKADSSEDTDEEEEVAEVAESSETFASTHLVTESAQVPKKKTKFFLNEHDLVIDEGIQWLSQSLTQEICDAFDKIRPELVQVYKTRMVRAKRDAKDNRGRGRVRVRGPLRDRQQNKSDQNNKDKNTHQNRGTDMAIDGKFNSNRKFEVRGRGRGVGRGRGRGQIQGNG